MNEHPTEVGQLCIALKSPYKNNPVMAPYWNSECITIGYLGMIQPTSDLPYEVYWTVEFQDGRIAKVPRRLLILKKPKGKPLSKDIQQTRKSGAPSFQDLMQDLKEQKPIQTKEKIHDNHSN